MNNMKKELFDEQKEDLFNLTKGGYSDLDVRDYCAENNIPYRLAQDFIEETYKHLDNNGIDMEEVITLKQLSNVQNWIGKGVRIAFCLNEDTCTTNKIDIINFKQIKEQISNLEKFRVFRIDSLDDLICVYVTEIAD